MKKYNLAVGAMFKNEADSMEEWLLHYLHRGVDHFYLINDESNDDFMDIVSSYRKYITLFNSVRLEPPIGKHGYNVNKYFLKSLVPESEWALICDLDEYVWSPFSLNINDIIKEFEIKDINSYGIRMVLFGSNNHIKQPKSIVNSFTKRQIVPFTREINGEKYIVANDIKTISLTKIITKFHLHVRFFEDSETTTRASKLTTPPEKMLLRLNHYRLQSKERWIKRLIKTPDPEGYQPWKAENLECFRQSNDGTKYIRHSMTCISPNMPLSLEYSGTQDNYRSEKIFEIANECQNEIEDLDLVKQNIEHKISYEN